jgi:hypothetical protein
MGLVQYERYSGYGQRRTRYQQITSELPCYSFSENRPVVVFHNICETTESGWKILDIRKVGAIPKLGIIVSDPYLQGD